jgi:hypothetical protein
MTSDEDDEIIAEATYALSQIARWSADKVMDTLFHVDQWLTGTQAIVDAIAPDYILKLSRSRSPDIRKWTCELVGRLAAYKSTAPIILELNLSVHLVVLLR